MYLHQTSIESHCTETRRREELATVFLQRLALDTTLVTRKKSFDTKVELLYESVGDIDLFNLVGSCKCLWLYFAPHQIDAERCSLFSSFLFGFVPGQDSNIST